MVFQKRHKLNLGRKLPPYSKERKEKIKRTMIRDKIGFQKGYVPWNKGKKGLFKQTEEHKKKLKKLYLGKSYEELYGKEKADIHKRNISESCKGRKPWNYIDGRSKLLSPLRYGDDWEKIRYLVYLRDKFTCQHCKERMGKIAFHIHHKIPFLINFDNSLNNLITLCRSCHMKEEMRLRKELKCRGIQG